VNKMDVNAKVNVANAYRPKKKGWQNQGAKSSLSFYWEQKKIKISRDKRGKKNQG